MTDYYVATRVGGANYFLKFRDTSDWRYKFHHFSFEGILENATKFTSESLAKTAKDVVSPRTRNKLFIYQKTINLI